MSSALSRSMAVRVFLCFAFTYYLSALVRAITATLSPTLIPEFGLQSSDLGLLAGGYFLGFSLMQLPMGNWLDRHGPNKVILSFLVAAVLGCVCRQLHRSIFGPHSHRCGRVLLPDGSVDRVSALV